MSHRSARKAPVYPIKTDREIEVMAESGKILRSTVNAIVAAAKEGISTLELDVMAEKMIRDAGGKPAFKGLYGFPYTVCMSLNDGIVHGFPSKEPLKSGDILSLDCGVRYKGFCSDMAWTVIIGETEQVNKDLLRVTQESLEEAIKVCQVGNRIGDIGKAVEKHVTDNGFHVIEGYGGHGIGKELHEDPRVENIAPEPGMPNGRLRAGMVMAIEPMVAVGTGANFVDPSDKWTVRTKDGSMAAHFEHTVAITNSGPRILTQ